MVSIKNRIKKLEKLQKLQPSGLQHLSDDELNARISAMCYKPEIHDWLEDDTNNDPLRLRIIELTSNQSKNEY